MFEQAYCTMCDRHGQCQLYCCFLFLNTNQFSGCVHVCVHVCGCVYYVFGVSLFLTVVDCNALPNPTNGQVNHAAGTTFGRTATYSCNTGYNLVGDNIHTCQAHGEWSGNPPTCQCMLLTSVLV